MHEFTDCGVVLLSIRRGEYAAYAERKLKYRPSPRRLEDYNMQTYTAYAEQMHNYIRRCAVLNFIPHDENVAYAKRTARLAVQK